MKVILCSYNHDEFGFRIENPSKNLIDNLVYSKRYRNKDFMKGWTGVHVRLRRKDSGQHADCIVAILDTLSLLGFVSKEFCKPEEKEIKEVAKEMRKIVQKIAPGVFNEMKFKRELK